MIERTRKQKAKPTFDGMIFATPDQKLLRFLMSEPTTTFTPRVLSSRLKGVRGLGGAEGILKILHQVAEIGLIQFVDNNRAVSVQNDRLHVQLLKTLTSVCDLEGIQALLEPISSKGILYGSRASGQSATDSTYELFVVSENASQVEEIISSHPLGKRIEMTVWGPDDYVSIESRDPSLAKSLEQGIVMWGSSW